jgi:AbiJ N-terminal domain 3
MDQAPRIPLDKIREEIAETIWRNVSAQDVPRVCKSLGIQTAVADGEPAEAFSSKRRYVRNRLLEKSKAELLEITENVLAQFDAPKLSDLLSESTVNAQHRVSVLVRKDVLKALDSADNLSGETNLIELLASVFGKEVIEGNPLDVFLSGKTLVDQITRHYLNNPDWTTEQLLIECGALTCSQNHFFDLLTKVLHPLARRGKEQEELAEKVSVALRRDGFEVRQTGIQSGYAIYGIVRVQHGVSGAMKNLIFASTGEKPELIFRDAVNNDVEIVKNADKVLIFDRPLPPSGLFLWKDLLSWWKEREGLTDEAEARKMLYRRLQQSVIGAQSPGEIAVFRGYYERFGPLLGEKLPVLIPQVYLHYDPYTKRERGDEEFLVRQRMDFLLMLENGVRIVIEVDGRHHYADPSRYATMCREDRRLRLLGYEMYRLGAAEFSDTSLSPLKIGPVSRAVVSDFFDRLLRKHGVL